MRETGKMKKEREPLVRQGEPHLSVVPQCVTRREDLEMG